MTDANVITDEVERVVDGEAAAFVRGERLSLRQNFAWTFMGRMVYVGCQWGMLTVLAKLGSPEMVGRFSLGLALTAPIIMFSMLQLRGVQATDARREYEFGHYLALRLSTSAFALLAIGVVTFLSGYRGEMAFVIIVVGVGKVVESVSDAYYGLMQQRERMDRIAMSLVIKGPLLLAALGFTVYFTNSVLWGSAAMVIVYAVMLLGYERTNARRVLNDDHARSLMPLWQWSRLVRLAWLALPLGVVMAIISLNTNIPRYFVERLLGERELGYFSALAYLMVAGNTVIGAVGQSASPRLAQYYAEGQRDRFSRLLGRLAGIGILLGLAAVTVSALFGRHILAMLYRPDYAQHADAFVWLTVASGISFVASFLGYGMTAARVFRMQMALFAGSSVLMALVCVMMIPRGGLIGAAQALLIVSVANLLGSTAIVGWALRGMPHKETRAS